MLITELKLLYKYALNRKFLIETGGGGIGSSTDYIARAAKKTKGLFYSIDINTPKTKIEGCNHLIGWSLNPEDFLRLDHPKFIRQSRYKNLPDEPIALRKKSMNGETDLLRKTIEKIKIPLDFFFLDSGEYCGLPEWWIVKDKIKIGGIFACHDIYYPKSIKNFQVMKEIEQLSNWKILEKTASVQGLLIASKTNNESTS